MQKITAGSYTKVLENWVQAASEYFYTPAGQAEIMCYGTGESHHWAVQTNMNAFAAFAVLATSPELDENVIGMSRKELLDITVKMLRYTLRTHLSGKNFCSNNKQWGHSWISVLALERMMHGFDAIEEFISEDDKLAMRKILESESNNILDNYEIVAGIEGSENKPESNIWNGALLLRTAAYYPDTPRKDEYLQKATRFFINGISLPSDKDLTEIFNGKTVQEWHIGPNFTQNYSLNHHGYMNVGYMVICMSNIAMLHFSLKARGITPPDEVYFHAEELWNAIKQFTFSDGRLLRIGGDIRARYCYCQDYALPMWLFALDKYADEDAVRFESGWLELVQKEISVNEDGAFLSTRLQSIEHQSPYYYTRLEGDRAVTMSYGAYWRRLFALPEQTTSVPKEAEIVWQDKFHGATMVRDTNRVTSWVWIAGQGPSGLCVSLDRSDMAEWQNNLSGELITSGISVPTVISNEHETFNKGFVNSGCLNWTESQPVGEGEIEDVFARHGIAFAALPDNATVICLQYAETTRRIYLRQIKSLGLKMPNDIFNDSKREYYSAEGKIELNGAPEAEEIIKLNSYWINIDDNLSVFSLYGGNAFNIYRPAQRQISLLNKPKMSSLYADEICSEFKAENALVSAHETVIDTGAVLMIGINARKTQRMSKQQRFKSITSILGIRAVDVTGIDGKKYLLIANFSQEDKVLNLKDIPITGKYTNLDNNEEIKGLTLKPFTTKLLVQ